MPVEGVPGVFLCVRRGRRGQRAQRVACPPMDTNDASVAHMNTAEDSWLTYEQAAEKLSCSTKTIQRRVREGTLQPQLRPGSNARWLASNQVEALITDTAGAPE